MHDFNPLCGRRVNMAPHVGVAIWYNRSLGPSRHSLQVERLSLVAAQRVSRQRSSHRRLPEGPCMGSPHWAVLAWRPCRNASLALRSFLFHSDVRAVRAVLDLGQCR